MSKVLPKTTVTPPIQAIHHLAFRCRDALETRRFYEDAIGLEFAGAIPIETDPASGHNHKYLHIFFKMRDGNFVAFFDDPESVIPEHFLPRNPFDAHFAMSVETEAELLGFKQHFEAQGLEVVGPIDHVFVRSVYTYDPNGIPVEITCKVQDHDKILDKYTSEGTGIIARWTQETAQLKQERLASAAAPTAASPYTR